MFNCFKCVEDYFAKEVLVVKEIVHVVEEIIPIVKEVVSDIKSS